MKEDIIKSHANKSRSFVGIHYVNLGQGTRKEEGWFGRERDSVFS